MKKWEVWGGVETARQGSLEKRAICLSVLGKFQDDVEYKMVRMFIASSDREMWDLAEIIIKNKENETENL